MYKFSNVSKQRLLESHKDLQKICNELIKYVDFTVLCSHRNEKDQNLAFEQNRTKVRYPNSKHNKFPSLAVDIVPYPVDFKDLKRFYFLAGAFLTCAQQLRAKGDIVHKVRWGGDWDRDNDFNDQSFNDLPHFELVSD